MTETGGNPEAVRRAIAFLEAADSGRGPDGGSAPGVPPSSSSAPGQPAPGMMAPGWLREFTDLGLTLGVRQLLPEGHGLPEAKVAALQRLAPHEAAIVDQIERKLPPFPELTLPQLLAVAGVVIVLPRLLVISKVRKATSPTRPAPSSAGPSTALPPRREAAVDGPGGSGGPPA